MPSNLTISTATLFAFLLVLARVGGILVFVPIPGIRGGPEPARAAFVLAFTLALFPRWPVVDSGSVTWGAILTWVASEAALGIAIGVALAVVLEIFNVAAQVLGLQAGYAYASTIDPNTEADSGILIILSQLMAGLLFFALGLDREVLRLLALSLDKVPVGAFLPTLQSAYAIIRLASNVFTFGLRLALPVVALLVMVDVALALLGRVNQQLQLISLAFPIKMLVTLVLLGWTGAAAPRLMLELSGHVWAAIRHMAGM
jgi:flagellar biosynthetic protein FliR